MFGNRVPVTNTGPTNANRAVCTCITTCRLFFTDAQQCFVKHSAALWAYQPVGVSRYNDTDKTTSVQENSH